MAIALGAARKTELRSAHPAAHGPDTARRYKDNSPRSLADHREGSPQRGPERGEGPAERPKFLANTPKHVQHCFQGAGARDWWIYTWKREAPGLKTRVPYHCNSWRCFRTVKDKDGKPVEVGCARHEAAVTFARIKEAFDPLEKDGTIFLVMTLDRNGYYSGKPWLDVDQAFRSLGDLCGKFLKRLRRYCEARGWRSFGSKWVATVEAHRSGWPHINILIHCPELALELAKEREQREATGARGRDAITLDGELARHARESGWGKQSTGERGRSSDALAGYITKLAGLADATAGEVAKMTQAPTQAPARFRRLRAGTGFLPPRRTNPNVTGTMVRRTVYEGHKQRDALGRMRVTGKGHLQVEPLHKVGEKAERLALEWEGRGFETVARMLRELAEQQRIEVHAACYLEEDIVISEARAADWNRLARTQWKAAQVITPLVSTWGRAPPDSRQNGPPFDG